MKTIVINNRIHLIEDFTQIEVKVICPLKNIQKMLDETRSKLISKKEINLNYNHHAGKVFEIMVFARFGDVKKYLKNQTIHNYRNVSNYNAYIDLININKIGFGFAHQTVLCFENIITGLYAFGDCSRLVSSNSYTYYYGKNGYSKLRANTEFTENGNKRYIKTGKGWLSNRMF